MSLRDWVACQKYRMDVGSSFSGFAVNVFQNALLIGAAFRVAGIHHSHAAIAAATVLYPLGTWFFGWLSDRLRFMEAMNRQHNARNEAVQELLAKERSS